MPEAILQHVSSSARASPTTRSTLMRFMQRGSMGHSRSRHGEQCTGSRTSRWRTTSVSWRRITRTQVPISIDTMKPAVAKAALQSGASIVNDVAANRTDDAMWRAVAEKGAGYVMMHMQGDPQTMQVSPVYNDVVAEIGTFFEDRLLRLAGVGVNPEQVALDVGIGFGKTVEHNLQLLANLDSFTKWNRPVLLGASRKSFIPQVAGQAQGVDRLPGSVACACWAAQHGAYIVRTHDVAATQQALRVTEAILARRPA